MSIGEVLRSARAAAGWSVEDLSRATRIRGELLRAIEADDFSGCGGAVYARGHLRSIATQLGLDGVGLVAQYDAVHGAPTAPPAREIFEREVLDLPHRTRPNLTGAMVVAAAVLLVVALVSLFDADRPRPTDRLAGTLPRSSPSAATHPTPAAEPSPAGQPLAGLVATSGVSVRVRVVSTRSWIAAWVDGKQTFGRTMAAGTQLDFKGTRLVRLTIGNAGAVKLIVNGRDLGTPGGPGAVLRLEFGPGDPAGPGAG